MGGGEIIQIHLPAQGFERGGGGICTLCRGSHFEDIAEDLVEAKKIYTDRFQVKEKKSKNRWGF